MKIIQQIEDQKNKNKQINENSQFLKLLDIDESETVKIIKNYKLLFDQNDQSRFIIDLHQRIYNTQYEYDDSSEETYIYKTSQPTKYILFIGGQLL